MSVCIVRIESCPRTTLLFGYVLPYNLSSFFSCEGGAEGGLAKAYKNVKEKNPKI